MRRAGIHHDVKLERRHSKLSRAGCLREAQAVGSILTLAQRDKEAKALHCALDRLLSEDGLEDACNLEPGGEQVNKSGRPPD